MTRHAAAVDRRVHWWALVGADALIGVLGVCGVAQSIAPRPVVDITPASPPTQSAQPAGPVLQPTFDAPAPAAAQTSTRATVVTPRRPAPRATGTRPPATTANRAAPRTTATATVEPTATATPTTTDLSTPASTTEPDPTLPDLPLPTDLPVPTTEVLP